MSRLALGVALFALSAGCQPQARELQFHCEPETELCPDGMRCLPFGLDYFCQVAEDSVCGNGVLEPGEQCDATTLPEGLCEALGVPGGRAHCVFPMCEIYCSLCSNGVVDLGELCDDGNAAAGDGCSPTCQTEICGNGVLDPGEQCDDGPGNNNWDPTACSLECRRAAAELIVEGSPGMRHLALSATHLFWFEDQTGIARVPLGGGPVEPLPLQVEWPGVEDLAVQAGFVYWLNNSGELRRMTTAGEAETLLASGLLYSQRFALDANHAYVAASTPGASLVKVPLEGGLPVTLVPDVPVYELAVDVGHVYWTFPGVGVSRVAKGGGAPTVLATPDSSYGIAVDDTHAFFTTMTEVWKVPVDGGSPSLLAPLWEPVDFPAEQIVIDASHAYLVARLPDFSSGLVRIPIEGGEPQRLAPAAGAMHVSIAMNATHVYFTTESGIYRIAK